MKRTGTFVVLAALATGAGCASYQTSGSPRATLPLPAEIQQYYRYLSVDPVVTARTTERHPDYSVKDVTLFEPGASEPIQIIWFAPKQPGPRPLILISPIRGSDTIVVDDCARVFPDQRQKNRTNSPDVICLTGGLLLPFVTRKAGILDQFEEG